VLLLSPYLFFASGILSKSNYLKGLEGARHLWTVVNAPEKIPEEEMTTDRKKIKSKPDVLPVFLAVEHIFDKMPEAKKR